MAKKKHKTPPHLDYLFERKIVTKQNYKEFWQGYWEESRARDKERYVNNFVSELQMEIPGIGRKSGTVTISKKAAEEQAKNIEGYVIRRNKKGRFSKTGTMYQAIVRKKRNK